MNTSDQNFIKESMGYEVFVSSIVHWQTKLRRQHLRSLLNDTVVACTMQLIYIYNLQLMFRVFFVRKHYQLSCKICFMRSYYYLFLVFAGIMRANWNFSQCILEQTSKKSSQYLGLPQPTPTRVRSVKADEAFNTFKLLQSHESQWTPPKADE